MTHSSIARQRGAATLVSAVIILVLMTMITFFANRNILFERKTAANQYRSTKAIEAAEAGVEWTIANLNSMRRITSACATSTLTSDHSLRDKYLDPDGDGSYAPVPGNAATNFSAATPLCTLIGGAWSCSCPSANPVAAPTAAACTAPEGCPTFRVGFANMAGDATLVRVSSTGCTNSQAPCVAGAGTTADGTATINQVMKLLSGLATLPAAALTAKGNVDFGSNAISATNTDPGTNGITINAGGNIGGFINSTTVVSLPGTPPGASLVGNDDSLSSLSDDQMFKSFFGMTKEQYQASPATTTVTCSGVCNTPVLDAISAGARTMWIEGDMTLNSNGTYGSPTAPVILVVNGNVHVQGTITIYGVLYCQDGTWDNTGGGDAQIVGAAIAEGSFTATGTPNPTYDPNVLKRLRETTGQYAKVPGGWRDF
jgi:Tfp pilus assembly protein PilX